MDSTPALLHVDAEYGRKYSGIQPSWRSNGAVARPLTNNSRRNVDLRTDRRFYPYSSFAWLFSGRAWIRDGDVFHGECEGVCFACFHGGHSSKGRRADGG